MENVPSISLAREHFHNHHVPRRIKEVYRNRVTFRPANPNEVDSGELYPLHFVESINFLSHFGLGVGIYFVQLLTSVIIFLFTGLLAIGMMVAFSSGEYRNQIYTSILQTSAICPPFLNVQVNTDCSSPNNSSSCITQYANYRPDCELPFTAVLLDLIISCMVVALVVIFSFLENEITDLFDNELASGQDYTIMVSDPTDDASNPDEWYQFFKRWGPISCVTICRNNNSLLQMLYEKKSTEKEMLHQANDINEKAIEKLRNLELLLEKSYQCNYKVCRVFVTFEFEESKEIALQELEVDNFSSFFDYSASNVIRFRGTNVLNVIEPPEPDSIKWQNVGVSVNTRIVGLFVSSTITIALLCCVYFLVVLTNKSASLLPIVVFFVDLILCTLFDFLTKYEYLEDEASFEKSLEIKLFFLRILLATIIPYVVRNWNSFLDEQVISTIFSVTVSLCFSGSITSYFDIPNNCNKYILGPLLARSQNDLLKYWKPTYWRLSDRYTEVAKILFACFFYFLLAPSLLLIAASAVFVIYIKDTTLLLRRWKKPNFLNTYLAYQFRKQIIFCVAAHMFFWHSNTQKQFLFPYKICTVIVIVIAAYLLLFESIFQQLRDFIFPIELENIESTTIPFSASENAFAYIPMYNSNDGNYLATDTSKLNPKVLSRFFKPDDHFDLVKTVPETIRSQVLSCSKSYVGNEFESVTTTSSSNDKLVSEKTCIDLISRRKRIVPIHEITSDKHNDDFNELKQ